MQNSFLLDADIPAGNILVDRIDGDDVYVRPDLRDTEGDWFYWHFRIRAAAGRTLRFHMTREHTLTALAAAVSLDQGQSWDWLGPGQMDEWTFQYRFGPDADDVRFAMAMPYPANRLEEFLRGCESSPRFGRETLCQSPKGRPVPMVRIADQTGRPSQCVLLTARHHCCEMMASYAMEGIIDAALAKDELGRWFGEHVEFLVVPFVDFDGATDGDQGKNRRPHDHNRDYNDEPIYPEVAAIMDLVPRWLAGRPLTALDLHCPWIRGMPRNETIQLIGSPDPAIWAAQCRFGEILQAERQGPLPYRTEDNLPFGQEWNTDTNFDAGRNCSRWAASLEGTALATTIELPYALAHGVEVNPASARAFGTDVARALRAFLQPNPPTTS